MLKRILASLAVVTAAGAGTLATTGWASATPSTATATTHLTNRPDSGYSGNTWADDNLVRTVTVRLVGPDTVSGLYDYTATLHDTGTASALTGATSPGSQAVAIKGAPVARVSGSGTYTFTANTSQFSAKDVPFKLSGSAGPTDTWPEYFFAPGTQFTGMGISNWTWVYTDSRHCQTWTDAYNGSQATSGDITGVSACPVPAPKPVIRHLHTDWVSSHSAEVSWNQTVTSTDLVTVTGPGLGRHGWTFATHNDKADFGKLRPWSRYQVTVQPTVNGKPAGHSASISFRTR
ncbi:MAG TPA: hypothetical protein VHE33_10445 [Acidobacteriaceae bacterium]|nr:hypothetical protein [Acidobacteriaceae bacterium]